MSRPVSDLLSDDALALLRAGFNRAQLYAVVRHTLNTPLPTVAGWTDFIMDEVFKDDGPLTHAERELIIISQLCAQGEAAPLATHIYWGLVEGLTPQQVAQAIVVTGTYAGAQRYVVGIRVMAQTLHLLAECASAGPEGAAGLAVAKRLLALFPG